MVVVSGFLMVSQIRANKYFKLPVMTIINNYFQTVFFVIYHEQLFQH